MCQLEESSASKRDPTFLRGRISFCEEWIRPECSSYCISHISVCTQPYFFRQGTAATLTLGTKSRSALPSPQILSRVASLSLLLSPLFLWLSPVYVCVFWGGGAFYYYFFLLAAPPAHGEDDAAHVLRVASAPQTAEASFVCWNVGAVWGRSFRARCRSTAG